MKFILLALFIIFLIPPELEALPFVFYPVEDSYVKADFADTSFGSEERLGVGDWFASNKATRSFLKFDISGIGGWDVLEAKLWLYHYWSRGIVGDDFNLYRVSEAWNETTLTWNNQPGFEPGISSYISITGGTGWRIWEVTDLVRGWANGSYSNYGMLIENDLDGYNEYERLYFRSKEYSDNNYWPKLEVEAVPEPMTLLLFSTGLFALVKLKNKKGSGHLC